MSESPLKRPLRARESVHFTDRARQAVKPQVASEVSDFAWGLELGLRRRRDNAAATTELLLLLDIDPGDLLVEANGDLELLRGANPDLLVTLYRAVPESIRTRFRDAGRRDRESAERITHALIGLLAALPGSNRRHQ